MGLDVPSAEDLLSRHHSERSSIRPSARVEPPKSAALPETVPRVASRVEARRQVFDRHHGQEHCEKCFAVVLKPMASRRELHGRCRRFYGPALSPDSCCTVRRPLGRLAGFNLVFAPIGSSVPKRLHCRRLLRLRDRLYLRLGPFIFPVCSLALSPREFCLVVRCAQSSHYFLVHESGARGSPWHDNGQRSQQQFGLDNPQQQCNSWQIAQQPARNLWTR